MSVDPLQFAEDIVMPSLRLLEAQAGIPVTPLYTNLVMGTLAQESMLGTYVSQVNGPALGPEEIEGQSLDTLLASLTAQERSALANLTIAAQPADVNAVGNFYYAVAVVRLFYRHKPGDPASNTVSGLFAYYKQWYNTPAGAATLAEWIDNWKLTGISLPP